MSIEGAPRRAILKKIGVTRWSDPWAALFRRTPILRSWINGHGFLERGLPTQLVPNRDVGVQLHGKLWGNTLAYQVGYFNGTEDGGSGDIETTDDGKDVAARLFVQPFDQTQIEPLKKFGLGVAITAGGQKKKNPKSTVEDDDDPPAHPFYFFPFIHRS